MRWRWRSTEMWPGGRALVGEVFTPLAVPKLLLRVECCAIRPASLLPEGGAGHPSALLFSSWFDQVAAVASVSHVQPQLVGLWRIPWQTINLRTQAAFTILSEEEVFVCFHLAMSGAVLPTRGRARLPVSGNPLHVTAGQELGIEWCTVKLCNPDLNVLQRFFSRLPGRLLFGPHSLFLILWGLEVIIGGGLGSHLSSDWVIAPSDQVPSASTTLSTAPKPIFGCRFLYVSVGTCSIPLFAIRSVVCSSESPLLST